MKNSIRMLIACAILVASAVGADYSASLSPSPLPSLSSGESAGRNYLLADTEVGDVEVSDDEGAIDVSRFVHRIDVTSGLVTNSGSCVCVGDGVLLTAKHNFSGLGSGYTIDIDGDAVAASVRFDAREDFAVVTVPAGVIGFDPAEMNVEGPGYLDDAEMFGCKSGVIQGGIISNSTALSMPVDAAVIRGDSGGGVFVDGKLCGIVTGCNPSNFSVCYFVSLATVKDLVATSSPEAAAHTPTAPGAANDRGKAPRKDHGVVYLQTARVSDRPEDMWCAPCNSLHDRIEKYGRENLPFELVVTTGGVRVPRMTWWSESRGTWIKCDGDWPIEQIIEGWKNYP